MNNTLTKLAAWCAIVVSYPLVADATNPLTGFYYGTATIVRPATIGVIDLAFYLDVTGTTFQKATSYVDLEQTLLFPALSQINGKDVGPRVSGTLSPTSFTLTTNPFKAEVSGKSVTRLVKLSKTTVTDGGASLSGTFTETVKGLTKETLTITGPFRLVKPLPVTADSGVDRNADGCLDLSEIRAGGNDATQVDFSDLSAAFNLHRHPQSNLRVGNPPGPTCANPETVLQSALDAYYGAQP